MAQGFGVWCLGFKVYGDIASRRTHGSLLVGYPQYEGPYPNRHPLHRYFGAVGALNLKL